jgi:uncharacterized protein (DUF342 family)
MTENVVGQRKTWRFAYEAREVAQAAGVVADYHRQRQLWWMGQHSKAVEEAEHATVSVQHHEVTGGTQVHIAIDPRIAARITQCESKIASHREKAEEFERWTTALRSARSQQFWLDVDDIHYFRLGGLTSDDQADEA